MTTVHDLKASNQLATPSRGLLAALQNALTPNQFFAGLYVLGVANGLLGRILLATNTDGWWGVLSIDISVIVLFACFAGISTLLSAHRGEHRDVIRPSDLAVAGVFLCLVILPIFALSWVAVTGLSLYILIFANGGTERRRGAIILLALTVPMLWSRLVFQLFLGPILEIDAVLVSSLLGTERIGNMIGFADKSGHMVVLPYCSSFANMSLAFLCWVSVTQWAKHRWSSIDILWSALACFSVLAVNVARISLMGLSQWHHQVIHNEWGAMVANYVMLCLIIGFSVLGARRELFSRA